MIDRNFETTKLKVFYTKIQNVTKGT